MTLGKAYLLISSLLGWLGVLAQDLILFPFELFSFADFIGGLIGNAVFGVAYIVYFEKKAQAEKVGLTKRTYVMLLAQVIGAGISSFVLLSLLRSVTGGVININVTSKLSYGISVVLGFFYSYVITPEFLEKLFKRAEKKFLGDE